MNELSRISSLQPVAYNLNQSGDKNFNIINHP